MPATLSALPAAAFAGEAGVDVGNHVCLDREGLVIVQLHYGRNWAQRLMTRKLKTASATAKRPSCLRLREFG